MLWGSTVYCDTNPPLCSHATSQDSPCDVSIEAFWVGKWHSWWSTCHASPEPTFNPQNPSTEAVLSDMSSQHWRNRGRRIPGCCWWTAWPNQRAPGSVRDLVLKNKAKIGQGRHLSLTSGLLCTPTQAQKYIHTGLLRPLCLLHPLSRTPFPSASKSIPILTVAFSYSRYLSTEHRP